MKRRDLLSAGALGIAGTALCQPVHAFAIDPILPDQSSAALLPLRVDPRRLRVPVVEGVQIGRAFPDPGASEPGSLELELGVDVDGSTCRIVCWQQVRYPGSVTSPASGVFMPFVEGRTIDLHVTTRSAGTGKGVIARQWRTVLSPGTWLVVSARRLTGSPPTPEDVRIGAAGQVEMRDGKPVDFDSVLLVAL